MDLGLSGKKAVITGGSRGIGRAIANLLVAEGASVAICARNEEGSELRRRGARAKCYRRRRGRGRQGRPAGLDLQRRGNHGWHRHPGTQRQWRRPPDGRKRLAS